MTRWRLDVHGPRPLLMAGLLAGCFGCTGCHDSSAPAAGPTATPPSGQPSASTSALPAAEDGGGIRATADASNETIIHAEDDGNSFDVPRGATVTFALPSNAGTGYIWTPTQVNPQVLARQGDRTSEISSGVPGAAKVDVYRFVAQGPGTTTVEMALKRPFGASNPARVVRVTVSVH